MVDSAIRVIGTGSKPVTRVVLRASPRERGELKPAGMTADRAIEIALNVLNMHGGRFPQTLTIDSYVGPRWAPRERHDISARSRATSSN